MADMTKPPMLDKKSVLGFGLQDGFDPGTCKVPDRFIPLIGSGADINLDPHQQEYLQTGGTDSRHAVWDPYNTYPGFFECPIIPGAAYLSDLFTWASADPTDATDRDSYNQAKWATIVLFRGSIRKVGACDCKCRQLVLTYAKGEVISARFEFEGLKPYAWTPAATAVPTGLGYYYRETALSVNINDVGAAADINYERVEITVDQGLEDSADGMRIQVQDYPEYLDNLTNPNVSGTAVRDPRDSTMFDAFLARQGVDWSLVSTRGANTFTVAINNSDMSRPDHPVGGSGNVRQTSTYNFLCREDPPNVVPQCKITIV